MIAPRAIPRSRDLVPDPIARSPPPSVRPSVRPNPPQEEKRKAMFNEVVSKLADVCFDKCVTRPADSLDRYESACLSNCALRYLETGQVIMQRIGRMNQ
jgi:import inner membrane translocase subunit TIM8